MNNRQEFQSPNDLRNIQDAVSLLRNHSKRLEQKYQDSKASTDPNAFELALKHKNRHARMLSQHETLLSMLHSGEFDKHINLSKQLAAAERPDYVRPTRDSSDAEWDAHIDHVNNLQSMQKPLAGLSGKIPGNAYHHIVFGGVNDWSEKELADVKEHISETK